MLDPWTAIGLFLLALAAGVINGAVGYGFPAITTPVALLWINPLILLPAVVAADVFVNAILLYRVRQHIAATRARALPVIYGLLPGIIIGTIALSVIGASAPNAIKLIVYSLLLPLCIIQLLGVRRPIQSERTASPFLGAGIGCLYALTTISGPPLAIFWRNQGLSKDEFRCTMATIRISEACMTLGTYLIFQAFLGATFYNPSSLALVPLFIAGVVIGVPLGTLLLRTVSREFFARFVMAVDGLIVSFALANTLASLKLLTLPQSYLVMAALFTMFGALTYYAIWRAPNAPLRPPSGASAGTAGRPREPPLPTPQSRET